MKKLLKDDGEEYTPEMDRKNMAGDIGTLAFVGCSVGYKSIAMNLAMTAILEVASVACDDLAALKGAELEAANRRKAEHFKQAYATVPDWAKEKSIDILNRAIQQLRSQEPQVH